MRTIYTQNIHIVMSAIPCNWQQITEIKKHIHVQFNRQNQKSNIQ